MASVSRDVEVRGVPQAQAAVLDWKSYLEKGGTVQSWLEQTVAYPPILPPP